MSLQFKPSALRALYDFFRITPPFNGWSLPPGHEVEFKVGQSTSEHGSYCPGEDGHHVISISTATCGHFMTVAATMAHEMVHLRHELRGWGDKGDAHGPRFCSDWRRVAAHHGFDPKGL